MREFFYYIAFLQRFLPDCKNNLCQNNFYCQWQFPLNLPLLCMICNQQVSNAEQAFWECSVNCFVRLPLTTDGPSYSVFPTP